MQRMEKAGLEVPLFMHCSVDEVTAAAHACWYSDGGWEWGERRADCEEYGGDWKAHKQALIRCNTLGGRSLEIHPQGMEWKTADTINRGDVVVIPLKEGRNEPNGVLGMSKDMTWVANAPSDAIKVETPAECPSLDTILGSK